MVLERNPMPSITGRVCPHPCQAGCSRADFDEPVSTRAIERFVGDQVLDDPSSFMAPPPAESGKKVAVVGAGPAGLCAAYYLRRAGHAVTVFDRMEEAGGMLRYSIPAYRLPKDVLKRQVGAYAAMGVRFVQGAAVGEGARTLAALRRDFDAVFVATGGWKQKTLPLEGQELLGSGLEFLADVARGGRQVPGRKVLVIGGGSVAVDVAITAKRLGAADVTMACLEARDIMPAIPEDIEQADEEAIHLLPSWGPHRVLARDGKLAGLELVRCTSVFDREGRFRPSFDPTTTMTVAAWAVDAPSTTMTVEADCVLVAIGQGPDLGYLEGAIETRRGVIAADVESQATSQAGVFAGGDAVTGASTVVAAIGAGRRAAVAIDAALRGAKPAATESVAAGVAVNTAAIGKTSRPWIPPRCRRRHSAASTAAAWP